MKNLFSDTRKAAKLSQQQVADSIGISRQAYGLYETGKREPDLETLIKIAELFNTSVDYLLGRNNNFLSINVLPTKNEQLTKEEKEILEIYRNIDQGLQGRALAYMRRLKETAGDEISLTQKQR